MSQNTAAAESGAGSTLMTRSAGASVSWLTPLPRSPPPTTTTTGLPPRPSSMSRIRARQRIADMFTDGDGSQRSHSLTPASAPDSAGPGLRTR